MSEVDAADALQADIEAAEAAGNQELAQSLYQRQQGTTDPYSLEPLPEPELPDTEGDTAAETGSRELVVATDADDETVAVVPEMDFASNPDSVAHAVACMEVWGEDEVAPLKARWGSDMGANLAYFEAFTQAHPDVHELLVASGFGDHPAIVEAGAILGRRYATAPGDPGEITTQKGITTMEQNMTTDDIEAEILRTEVAIDEAKRYGDAALANRLYQGQQALFRMLPGGSEPVVGSSGGPTA